MSTASSTSQALVVNNNGLVPLDEVRVALDRLIDEEDLGALADGRAKAEAYAAYERRKGAKERSDYFGRVKILAEAAIGIIDLRNHPWAKPLGPPLVIEGMEIGRSMRNDWRVLGQGQLQGMLDAICDYEASDPAREVGTDRVVRELRRRGVGYVDASVLKVAIKKAAESRPGGLAGLARSTGVARQTLRNHTKGHKRYLHRFSWPVAVKLCEELGVDLSALPQGRPPKRRLALRRRLGTAKRPKGGRWDRVYTAHRRMMQEVFELTGESNEPDLWLHLHAIEDFLKKRV